MTKSSVSNRILPAIRWLAAFLIPFLALAFVILYFLPHQSGQRFAWGIQPEMSAMMLAAAYAGGVVFFTWALLAQKWHHIKHGFLPVTTFASALGIATILHWENFTHGHIAFILWAGLYFTTPFIVFALWLRNRVQDPGALDERDFLLPGAVRLWIGGMGVITLVIAVLLFIVPSLMIPLWPWTLSPLTARVMSAIFALPAVVGVEVALDARWSAARVILQALSFSILLILIAAGVSRGDFDWSRPVSWLFTGGLGAILASVVAVYLMAEMQLRKQQ